WNWKGVTLDVTSAVADSSMLLLRYRVRSESKVGLCLAIRPFQVNPSTQFLNTQGGVSPIRTLAYDGEGVTINETQRLQVLTKPERFATATYDEGDVEAVCQGRGGRTDIRDPAGFASGALVYFEVGDRTIDLAVPLRTSAGRVADVAQAL